MKRTGRQRQFERLARWWVLFNSTDIPGLQRLIRERLA